MEVVTAVLPAGEEEVGVVPPGDLRGGAGPSLRPEEAVRNLWLALGQNHRRMNQNFQR